MTDPIQHDPAHGDGDSPDVPEPQLPQLVSTTFTGDPVLRVLVAVHNNMPGDPRMSITLTIPAGTISGMLVGFDAWRTVTGAWLREHGAGQMGADELASLFDGNSLDDLRPSSVEPWTIHLVDATLINGEHRHEFPTWRGRLIEVTGWSLGAQGAVDLEDANGSGQ